MKVARLWSHLEGGVPVLDPTLGVADEKLPKDEILRFLEGGSGVLRAPGLTEDWLSPDRAAVVPVGFRTDGSWLWSAELAFYLRRHGVVPEPDFVKHMSEAEYIARPATRAEVLAAEELLRG